MRGLRRRVPLQRYRENKGLRDAILIRDDILDIEDQPKPSQA